MRITIAILIVLIIITAIARAHDAPSGWQYPSDCCSIPEPRCVFVRPTT